MDLVASTDADEVYDVLVTHAQEALACDVCRIATIADDDPELVPRASSGEEAIDTTQSVPLTYGIAGHAYKTGNASVINDLTFTRSAHAESATHGHSPERERSVLTAPIGAYGVFQAFDHDPGAFSQTNLDWVEELIPVACAALERIQTAADAKTTGQAANQPAPDRSLEIVGNIAHDLRGPLTLAEGYLALARDEAAPDEQDAEPFDRVAQAHTRIDQLIDEMLTLAGTDETMTTQEQVDLSEVADASWETVVMETTSAQLAIDGTVEFEANPVGVKRVFENLFRNAVEHAGPDVTVQVGPLGDDDGVYVADDGPGIAEPERERIFMQDVSIAQEEPTEGLGLQIVRRIVDAHDWEIAVTESDTGGARFEITGLNEE